MSGRPREFDTAVALEQAMDLFWSQGYEATGIAELSDRLGIGRQSMYNAFGDKRTLFLAALEHYQNTMLSAFVAKLEAPGSPLGHVHEVLDVWEASAGNPEHRGCLMVNTMAELGFRDTGVRLKLDRMNQTMEDAFYGALRRAQEAGELSDSRDARALARALTNTGQGLSVVGKVASSPTYAADVINTTRRLLT